MHVLRQVTSGRGCSTVQIQVCCLGKVDPRLIRHVPRGGYIEGTISFAKSLATAVSKGGLGFSGWACLDDGTFCATHSQCVVGVAFAGAGPLARQCCTQTQWPEVRGGPGTQIAGRA